MGKKVVMAFGAFDGLHMGHLHYLKEAKKLGDYLIIGLARDKATWLPKSSAYRLPEGERKKLLEEINLADEVALGGKNDALEAVKRTDPDILAISEYSPVDITLLQKELKSLGLKGTVVAIKKYKPTIYNRVYYHAAGLQSKDIMGLPTHNHDK